MGNSIANDPCYGGELFYGDLERKQRAVEVLRNMRKEGKHPLSKVPHLGDPELDNYIPNTSAATVTPHTMGSVKSQGVRVETEAVTRPVSTGEEIVTAEQSECSSISTPPLAQAPTPTSADEDKSFICALATAEEKTNIELEIGVHVTQGESLEEISNSIAAKSKIPGIEEIEQGAEVEVKVAVDVGAGTIVMTSAESTLAVEVQGGTETDKEYLVRTCRYCSI